MIVMSAARHDLDGEEASICRVPAICLSRHKTERVTKFDLHVEGMIARAEQKLGK